MKIFFQENFNDCGIAVIKTFFYFYYKKKKIRLNNNYLNYSIRGISVYNFEKLLNINKLKLSFFMINLTHKFWGGKPFGFIYLRTNYNHFYIVINVKEAKWLVSDMNRSAFYLPIKWINKHLNNLIFFQINK